MTATRFVDLPVAHPGRRLLSGRTPSFALQADPRFSYALFVPEDLRDDEPPLALWVFVHGTGRRFEHFVRDFAVPARAERAVVLAPLFPVGIGGPDDTDSYKRIAAAGVRYDEVLLAMVDEVAHRWPVAAERFFLHGFSGGGQFANRFALRHPDRLTAVSIGAPGQVTLPTAEAGIPVPVQVVVGALDDDGADVAAVTGVAGAAGRLTQARELAEALRADGSSVTLDVVDGVGHDGEAVTGVVAAFLVAQLARSGS